MATSEVKTAKIPRGVWALGFVSMFMDISSEMIHALLPVFLVRVLGAGTEVVGLIEGVGEATASISKLFSGWISDAIGKRKLLAVFGYSLATLSKPIFAVAPSPAWVGAARFSDRLGKGIRGAPRDALVADLTPPEIRGAAFGLRQTLDTVGAFCGPLIGIGLMAANNDDYRRVFWFALIPGFIAVILLAGAVSEPPHEAKLARAPIRKADFVQLGRPFRFVVAIGGVFTLARFSEAFLILRVQGFGLEPKFVPLVLVVMNVIYALAAYPAGLMGDKVSLKSPLIPGCLALVLADLVLAKANGVTVAMVGVGLWGLHMGLTQGVLSALVAVHSPANLKGTAFGVFNLVVGIATLVASLLAGFLWQQIGPQAAFLAGAGITAVGVVWFAAMLRTKLI